MNRRHFLQGVLGAAAVAVLPKAAAARASGGLVEAPFMLQVPVCGFNPGNYVFSVWLSDDGINWKQRVENVTLQRDAEAVTIRIPRPDDIGKACKVWGAQLIYKP